jgi:hypothetical protein
MSDPMYFILGLVCGMVAVPILRALFSFRKHVPTVLGSSVPLTSHSIDFSRRYTIYTGGRFSESSSTAFHAVRIVGYVEKQARAGDKYYEDWIVAELPDGRKLYLTPHSIKFMEEVSDRTDPPERP